MAADSVPERVARPPQPAPERAKRAPERVARAAALIAVLTIASRLVGFGRIVVFNWTVGSTDLGDIYQAANTIPNIIFEIVAGGALASLVVPVLATPSARDDHDGLAVTTSALLTWVVGLLVPICVAVAVAAGPLVRLIAPNASPDATAVGTDMLRVFAPQLPLYGVGIVLSGALQTYRRFAWPVLAPLLSSLTVIGAYLLFAGVAGRAVRVEGVGQAGVLVLSVGTTLGVAVLSLCLLVPLRGTRLRIRPTFRLPGGATQVRRLALAGAVTVGAQQVSIGLAVRLASGGPEGSVVLYTLAQTIFLLPWAVLALPLATSAYPSLAEAGATGDDDAYLRRLAPAVRSLLLLCGLGVAAEVALAQPLARILVAVTAGHPPVGVIAAGVAGFAPGLFGYGLFALLSRALYARGAVRLAAGTTALGWAAVAASSVTLAGLLPPADRVAALALANSAGMTVLGGALLVAVVRRAGRPAVAGFGRTGAVALAATTVASLAGVAARMLLWGRGTPTVTGAVAQSMLCGFVVLVAFGAIAVGADHRDARPALVALARRVRGNRKGAA